MMIFSGSCYANRSRLIRYGLAVIAPVLVLPLQWVLISSVGNVAPFLLFTPAVMVSAWYGGLGPGLAATAISSMLANFFLLPPVYSLKFDSQFDLIRLAVFAGVGAQISFLSDRFLIEKSRAEAIAAREKTAARSLEQSEERYRLLIESVQEYAIYALDCDGNVTSWNSGAERLKGYQTQEILGQHFSCFYPPEAIAQNVPQESLRQTLVQGQFESQGWRLRKDGYRFWADVLITPLYDDAGKLQGFSEVVHDASDRKQMEEHLQQLNNRLERQVEERTAQLRQALNFEATLKRITDKVRDSLDEEQILRTAVHELGEGLGVRNCNAAVYDLEKRLSTICYEYNTTMFSMEGRISSMEEHPELYEPLLRGQNLQFCNLFVNPIRGRVTMLACPIFDDQGVIGDLWLVTDKEYAFRDTELRLVQQVANQCAIALRQAQLYKQAQAQVQALEQLNWLKDDFMSTVSHELRTPVSNMRMSIRMLEVTLQREEGLNNSRQRVFQYLDILKNECEREISLINDLLDLQRLESGKQELLIETVQVQEWLIPIVESFRERAQSRQQELRAEIPAQLPPLASDLGMLTRILTELLNNACKYTPPGETIVVRVASTAPQKLKFTVANSGVEIAASELPNIFDRFYRIPNADPWKQGGTGLGLALVQTLVEHLGGGIQVSSADGMTCFTVEVPNCLLLQPQNV